MKTFLPAFIAVIVVLLAALVESRRESAWMVRGDRSEPLVENSELNQIVDQYLAKQGYHSRILGIIRTKNVHTEMARQAIINFARKEPGRFWKQVDSNGSLILGTQTDTVTSTKSSISTP